MLWESRLHTHGLMYTDSSLYLCTYTQEFLTQCNCPNTNHVTKCIDIMPIFYVPSYLILEYKYGVYIHLKCPDISP